MYKICLPSLIFPLISVFTRFIFRYTHLKITVLIKTILLKEAYDDLVEHGFTIKTMSAEHLACLLFYKVLGVLVNLHHKSNDLQLCHVI